ncbi:TOBE domain-containing protein [Pandoraea apista]|uniref:Transporter n=1 Tax=Pandoraea apista TaxID=93218 RepID=A0A5E5P6K9_9BURK|nr:TOBE domain-containing protein [Pandoraea apista]AJE97165.1 transporter [Pandoraea apista]AKH71120.1 transporter [Pandoraea apista]AKI63391.1 transporter [Pandoraea apista]AVF41765.1 transporter [Pandoraea apista]OXS93557.1 transporter [Pandoraea apista]
MKTSARNQFSGKVVALQRGAVNDEVTLRTDAGQEIVAVITHASTVNLGLREGSDAVALIKASSVIVMVDADASKVSTRNVIVGKVSRVETGAVNSEVEIATDSGAVIAAIVTNESVRRLGLTAGRVAAALVKASSVILAVA